MKKKSKMKSLPKRTIYIDESGNTGEISNFCGEQPFFALGAVVLNQTQIRELDEIENNLRKSGVIQNSIKEIKSKNTFNNYDFTCRIIQYIFDNCIFVVELVEKRYHIACEINSCSIIPQFTAIESAIPPEYAKEFHINAANEIYDTCDDTTLKEYVECSKNDDRNKMFEILFHLFVKIVHEGNNEGLAKVLCSVLNSIQEGPPSERYARLEKFFPAPDRLPNGKGYWFLPYTTAFSNLYARLNYLCKGAKLTIIHDKQKQFHTLISDYKCFSEKYGPKVSKAYQKICYTNSFYHKENELHFEDSKSFKGIQWADVLTGFVNRSIMNYDKQKLPPHYKELLKLLLSKNNVPRIIFTSRNDYANEL